MGYLIENYLQMLYENDEDEKRKLMIYQLNHDIHAKHHHGHPENLKEDNSLTSKIKQGHILRSIQDYIDIDILKNMLKDMESYAKRQAKDRFKVIDHKLYLHHFNTNPLKDFTGKKKYRIHGFIKLDKEHVSNVTSVYDPDLNIYEINEDGIDD